MDAGNEQDRLVSHGGFTPDPGSPDSLAGSMIKNPPANAEDTGDVCSTPGSGRSPGVGDGNLLQYSCLESSMDRGAWWATVHRVTESDTTELDPLTPDPGCNNIKPWRETWWSWPPEAHTLLDNEGCTRVMRFSASGNCSLASHPGTHPPFSGIHPSHPGGCQCHSLFSNVRLPNVSVCLGCLNKVPDWVAATTEMDFLIVLQAENPRSRCWRFGFSWGFSPRPADGHCLPVSSAGLPSLVSLSLRIWTHLYDLT